MGPTKTAARPCSGPAVISTASPGWKGWGSRPPTPLIAVDLGAQRLDDAGGDGCGVPSPKRTMRITPGVASMWLSGVWARSAADKEIGGEERDQVWLGAALLQHLGQVGLQVEPAFEE